MATADRLYRDALTARPDCKWCPNGVDYEHFARARDRKAGLPPQAMAPVLAVGKPIIGYCGALARWFDYDLVGAVAAQRQDLAFVLIGPDYDHTLVGSGLYRLPNVTWLGPRPYSDLPQFLRYFDAAMIPFRLNPITHATSPLKLFEYMARGKPVVITPMQESIVIEQCWWGGMSPSSRLDWMRRLLLPKTGLPCRHRPGGAGKYLGRSCPYYSGGS